jgi:hypothetical protein
VIVILADARVHISGLGFDIATLQDRCADTVVMMRE